MNSLINHENTDLHFVFLLRTKMKIGHAYMTFFDDLCIHE